MPKKKLSPEEFAKNFVEQQAKVFKDLTATDDIFMSAIGRLVCEMLASNAPITLNSLLEECSQRRDFLSQKEKPELNIQWNTLNAMHDHLQNLKQQTGKKRHTSTLALNQETYSSKLQR